MAIKTRSGKRFVKAAGAIILTLATLLGSFGLVANNKANRVSDEAQVEVIGKSLGCDLSYMKHNQSGGIVRMMHNGDKPIYVHIKDEMNEEENELIRQSLDYVFGIVGKINDNYKYEIVDSDELNKQKILGRTTITYQEGAADTGLMDAQGKIYRDTNYFGNFSENDFYTNYVIEYDREESKDNSYDEKLYTFLHELLHAFGLDDVYVEGAHKKTDINYQNTVMKGYSVSGNIITPNDLGCLCSAYAEKLSGDELTEFISKAEKVCNDYEAYYYENRVEKLQTYENNKTIDLTNKDMNSHFEASLTDVDGTKIEQKVDIQIEGDKYIFKISGAGRTEECIATGEVADVNGVKVLKNVKFTGTYELHEVGKAKETIMDLYVVRLHGRDMLYDANNYSSMWGQNLENANELE